MNLTAARRILSRPAAHVLAAIEAGKARDVVARAEVRAMLAAPGADPLALYRAETDKARRVILLGVCRRGLSALD